MRAFRGTFIHFLDNPETNPDSSHQLIEDGLMLLNDEGVIIDVGEFRDLKKYLMDPCVDYIDYSEYIIIPGFVDSHIHYPQLEMIASYSGGQLLEWLERCVFATEAKYKDYEYAKLKADIFFKALLKNGTTSALVFTTVHKESTEAFFDKADELNMLMIGGKVLMDRNAPAYLLDTPEKAYEETDCLINKWHNKNRLRYAITPRFAPTSSEAQLQAVSALKKKHESVYLQTHLSENKNEVKWVQDIFPWSRDYTDVYEKYELLGKRSIFAHCAHLNDREFDIIKESNSSIAWCPCSNFFLGSGLFNINKAREFGIRLSLGSDVGGGNHIFMLQVMDEAYKVGAVQNYNMSPLASFYQTTLGNARALSIDDKVGNLVKGKDGDFLVINPHATPFLEDRLKAAETIENKLFCLQMLADKRIIKATYIKGNKSYESNSLIKESFF
ncbi:MAG TPA: guanine deaminase [Lentisphaeria bacterium]|nr:MAG: guanine deaminase [Lentisphaerae bacterium GWF2_38_69]HBM15995.1 guanine deaminase [Lentisphaeria bacterium]